MNTSVRLVKCPKCRKILPELPNIPVYKCGGCNTILQAKKQKSDIKGNGLRAQITDPIQNYEPNSVSSSSSPGGDNPSVESSPGSDTRGGQQFNPEKRVHTKSLDDYSHSSELNYLQDDKLSKEKNASAVHGERESLLDQDAGKSKSESLIHSSEKPQGRSTGDLSDSCDSFHDNADSSTEISNSGKKYDIKGNDIRAQEPDPIQKYEVNSVSSSSSPGGSHPSLESSPGSDTRGEQFKSVKPVDTDSSDDYPHPTKLNHLEDDKLSPEKNESEVQGERERLLDQDAGHRKSEPLIHGSEKPHDRTSGELSDLCDGFHENEYSFTEVGFAGKKYQGGYLPKLYVVTSVNEIEDSHGVLTEKEKCSGEAKSLDQHITHFSKSKNLMDVERERQFVGIYSNESVGSHGVLEKEERCYGERQSLNDPETTCSPKSEPLELVVSKEQQNIENEIGRYPNDIEDSQGELSREGKHSNELQSLDEPATHFLVNEPLKLDEENQSSSEDEEHSKVDERRYHSRENGRTRQNEFPDQIFEYSQKRETAKETSPEITAAGGPLIKSIVFAPLLPDEEYLKEFDEAGPSIHRISSEETLDTLPINPRVPIGSMSKSPTRIYYAGDESESSYDGTEGLSAQVSRLPIRKFKGTGTTTTNRSRQTDRFRVKNKQQNGELLMHSERLFKQPNNFSGVEQDWRRQVSPEPRRHSHPMRTSMTASNNEPISRGAHIPRSSQLLDRRGTPASSAQNVFLHSGEFRRPDTVSDSDPERNELLRMVHELEDRINLTHVSKQMSGERLPFRDAEHYDNPTAGRNAYADFKYSGQQRSHPHSLGWASQSRSSRLGFSGEASLCRNHIDCRCSHCYHQSLHFPQKLSSNCIHCQHEAYNTYPCHSPSPQHYSSSEYSREIQADKKKHDHEMKMFYLREKQKVMKRHLRPVCGGAPIVNCYHCSELLQLPADFLLFRKRCHHLKCNTCNRILKFSLLEKSRLVPYVTKIQAPPPTVDRRTLASTSHANNLSAPEPVSFSDDIDPSLSRNGSTESGPSAPSSHSLLKNMSKGKLPSNQTPKTMSYRRMKTFMEIYQDNNKSSRYNIEAALPSSSTSTWTKPSSEIVELPATSGSPLHRLMGYASPWQVLFAKSDDDSDDDGMGFYMDQHIR